MFIDGIVLFASIYLSERPIHYQLDLFVVYMLLGYGLWIHFPYVFVNIQQMPYCGNNQVSSNRSKTILSSRMTFFVSTEPYQYMELKHVSQDHPDQTALLQCYKG